MAIIKVKNETNNEDLSRFKDFGEFENNIDEFGNVNLSYNNSLNANESCVRFDLNVLNYNENKIKDTYNVEFTELVSAQSDEQQDISMILNEYNVTLAENRNLNEIVNQLIDKYENNNDKSVINAMKTQIIDLRIQLGQGNYPSDFQDTFPFLPIS